MGTLEAMFIHKRRGGPRPGFTLMELLAVLGIVCILVALVLGLTTHAQRAAREGKARAELELIRNALQECMLRNGAYPAGTNLAAAGITNWLPAEFSFRDPWERGYRYEPHSPESYSLYSTGPHEDDSNDDIVSGR